MDTSISGRDVYTVTDEIDRLKEARSLVSDVEYQQGEREAWDRLIADTSYLIERRTRELERGMRVTKRAEEGALTPTRVPKGQTGAYYGLPDVNVRPLALPAHLLLPISPRTKEAGDRESSYDESLRWSDERPE